MSTATKTAASAAPDAPKAPNAISTHIRAYRTKYEPTSGVANRGSLDNGDAIAKSLRTMTPTRVMAIAERLLDLPAGELATRYEARNEGMRRMNAGNLIRNALKRGDVTASAIGKAIKAVA